MKSSEEIQTPQSGSLASKKGKGHLDLKAAKKNGKEDQIKLEKEIKNMVSGFGGTSSEENPVFQINLDNFPISPGLSKLEDEFWTDGTNFKLKIVSKCNLKKEKTLGSGNSGTVVKYIHGPSNIPIALKTMYLNSDETFLKHLKIELETLSKCSCSNIVKCYGFFCENDSIHIALEYMDYGSLTDIISKGSINHTILGGITYQVLKGLEYLHKNLKVIHRDIKPSNLLLNKNGDVKIADFGVSGKLTHTLSVRSTWVGTAIYMSPECIQGKSYTFATDIWSLGLTILECALGHYPFPELKSKPLLEMINFFDSPLPPLLPENEKYPKEMRNFLSACLNKDFKLRPSVTELLNHDWMKKYETINFAKYFSSWIGPKATQKKEVQCNRSQNQYKGQA